MTSVLTDRTLTAVASSPYIDLMAILLLITLLVLKELARASGGERASMLVRALNIGIAPLLLAFGFIILVRLMEILHPT